MPLDIDLARPVGPLPLGGWILVGAAGATAFVFIKRNQSNDSTDTEEPLEWIDTSGDPGVGTGSGLFSPIEPPIPSTPTVPTLEDNDDWGRSAINWLVSQGYDAARSDQAIRRFLAGEKLDPSEGVLVSLAIAHIGATPELLAPGPSLPTLPTPNQPSNPSTGSGVQKPVGTKPRRPPTPAPKPKPKKVVRYHVVRPGNTLSGLAKKYYGDSSKYPRIYNANKKGVKRADGTMGFLTNPNIIRVGQKLVIP